MSAGAVKVTVSDPTSGEVFDEAVINNDFLIICAGNRYLASSVAHQNGTAVLTVKVDREREGTQ